MADVIEYMRKRLGVTKAAMLLALLRSSKCYDVALISANTVYFNLYTVTLLISTKFHVIHLEPAAVAMAFVSWSRGRGLTALRRGRRNFHVGRNSKMLMYFDLAAR